MLKSSLNKSFSPAQLLLYTGIAGTFISILMFSTNNFYEVLSNNGPDYRAIVLMILTCLTTVAALFSFVVDTNLDEKQIMIPVGALAAATIGLLELSALTQSLSTSTYFYLVLFCNGILVYSISAVLIRALHLGGHWPSTIATGNTVCLGVVGLACILSQNWISFERSSHYLHTARASLIGFLPMTALAVFASTKSLYMDPKHWHESLLLRLRSSKCLTAEIGSVAIATITALIIAASSTILLLGNESSLLPIGVISSMLPLAFWHSYQKAKINFADRSQQTITAALAPPAAKRFLRRHMGDNKVGAATVGVRTPSFMVDHDPDGFVSGSMPASICQIRNQEIEKCVGRLLGPTCLHKQVMGSKILGSIDPELSLRSCVDVLILFSSLHIDAVQLVERRLSGLISLLPILDPDLSSRLAAGDIDKMLTRHIWLYHFDFGWADQQLVRNSNSVSYNLYHSLAPSTFHSKVFEYLKNKNRVGNFIWIGANARERLLQEAPMLSQIVQAWPVPMGAGEEQLVFLIKFEELIPRLQKYYSLEEKRKSLQDYDPSTESLRILNVIELQLQNSNNLSSLYQITKSIIAFPWNGFKEKDRALQALKKTYLTCLEELSAQKLTSEDFTRQKEAVRTKFIEAIAQIGYPSQILHIAQLDKIAMRHSATVIDNASQPWLPSFQESWTLMASTSTKKYRPAEVEAYLKFLLAVPDTKRLKSDVFVQCKAIEAFINLAANNAFSQDRLHETVIERYAGWLAESKAPLDICVLFLDGLNFLEMQLGQKIALPQSATEGLDRYLQRLKTILGENSHGFHAISSRWYKGKLQSTTVRQQPLKAV